MALVFPTSPTNGQVFTDTVTGNRYVYDASNGVWKYSSNNVGVTVGTAPPPINQVAPGAMWYNTNTGRTFILYDDGDSKQWVENIPAPGSFDSSTVAGYANAATLLAVAPAFAKANAALANTSGTFDGSLTTTGNLSAGSNPFGYKISANGASASATTWIGATNPQAVGGIGAGFIATIDGGNFAYNYQSGAGNYYITNANTNGGMYFSTNGGYRISILSGGNVGIGATSPADQLSIAGNVRMQAANTRLIGFNSTGAYQLNVSGGAAILFNTLGDGSQEIAFETHYSGNSHAERMRIDKSGNVTTTGNLTTGSRGIAKASMPSGSILQVQQAVITSVFSTTSTSFVDITSLGISITPTSSTSKILVMVSLYRGCASPVITNFRLTRAGTPIYLGDAAGSRVQSSGAFYVGNSDNQAHIGPVDIKYVDSPATTSAITYQVQMRTQGGETVFVGKTGGDSDGGAYPRVPASIIVMEIAQ